MTDCIFKFSNDSKNRPFGSKIYKMNQQRINAVICTAVHHALSTFRMSVLKISIY